MREIEIHILGLNYVLFMKFVLSFLLHYVVLQLKLDIFLDLQFSNNILEVPVYFLFFALIFCLVDQELFVLNVFEYFFFSFFLILVLVLLEQLIFLVFKFCGILEENQSMFEFLFELCSLFLLVLDLILQGFQIVFKNS